MSEKTMVTIDCNLIIPEGTEKVFENQYIHLDAGIKCDGTLIFRNCTIEPSCVLNDENSKKRVRAGGTRPDSILRTYCIGIGIDGKLEIDGCEVIHPGKDFLSGWAMTIKNTSFRLPASYDAVIDISGEARFENCSFIEEAESVPQPSAKNLIPTCGASLNNCTFENVSGKIEVATITGCSFTGCKDISCERLDGSTFTDCKTISIDGGCVRNCDFNHIEYISSVSADIDNCRFQKTESVLEEEGCVYIEDCKITHCSFDDVELRNGSYLIEGVGDACVEYCQFTNCRTDREDLELCHGKIETGMLRKRVIEVSIIQIDTCTGLDEIGGI